MDVVPSFRRYLHLRTALDAHPRKGAAASSSELVAQRQNVRGGPQIIRWAFSFNPMNNTPLPCQNVLDGLTDP